MSRAADHYYVVPTAQSVLHSGVHGRMRREERNIEKIDLQRARRYGMMESARHGRIKYTYGGIVFIYDPVTNREVTSFPSPDVAKGGGSSGSGSSSGTKFARPVMLPKKELSASEIESFQRKWLSTLKNRDAWTSHSVLVVDMSGSMRRDDVNGSRCRSDGVWLTLARDFVERPLAAGSRSATDLVSVVAFMDGGAEVVLAFHPVSWTLYNKLVDLREWSEIRPTGAGNYGPALDAAEQLLTRNHRGSCALSLLFFSDGRPSDQGDFAGRMGAIASRFGRRLSVACVGMADVGEADFDTLYDMVEEAKAYGSIASFGKPSLDTDSLSHIITSLASSLTTSRTELTNLRTSSVRKVRMDIRREKTYAPDDDCPNDNWTCYDSAKQYVTNFWSWDYGANDFVKVKDSRCRMCWKETNALDDTSTWELYDGKAYGLLCPTCELFVCCTDCRHAGFLHHTKTQRSKSSKIYRSECSAMRKERMHGRFCRKSFPSWKVAVKKLVFGEGAERIVRKFRFLDRRDSGISSFVGPVMVAKESRFVADAADELYERRMDYHREFMRTQALAARMAREFNDALADVSTHFDDPAMIERRVARIPRIEFLEPVVVQTYDPDQENEEYNILVEPMLEGEYRKFNDNMGMVEGRRRITTTRENNGDVDVDDLIDSMRAMGVDLGDDHDGDLAGDRSPPAQDFLGAAESLGAIEEGSEDENDEDSDDDSDGDIIDDERNAPLFCAYDFDRIKDAHVPQAFSHFTYEKSKKNLMVVDLQGVLTKGPDGGRTYQFTDPVIHKQRKKNKRKLKDWTFGRTDRGDKGMRAFLATHRCSELCRLLGLKTHGADS